MTRVWMYVLDSSKDPDNVRCVVPWMVDEDLIFSLHPGHRRVNRSGGDRDVRRLTRTATNGA